MAGSGSRAASHDIADVVIWNSGGDTDVLTKFIEAKIGTHEKQVIKFFSRLNYLARQVSDRRLGFHFDYRGYFPVIIYPCGRVGNTKYVTYIAAAGDKTLICGIFPDHNDREIDQEVIRRAMRWISLCQDGHAKDLPVLRTAKGQPRWK